MTLANAILRPGIVLAVLENGKITASAPGLFHREDIDLLPPIMPFCELCGSHSNSYSEPTVGDEVWVLNLMDNPLQLYWFRKDYHIEGNSNIFEDLGDGGTNVEVLCNRESGMGYASIYFAEGSGWVIKNDESRLQIRKDGSIELGMNWPNRTIAIDSQAVHLGTKLKNSDGDGYDTSHYACYGDVTADLLIDLIGMLKTVASVAKTNPYTMQVGIVLEQGLAPIENSVDNIISPHVKLN